MKILIATLWLASQLAAGAAFAQAAPPNEAAATRAAQDPVPDDAVGPTPRSQIRIRTRSGVSTSANSTLVPSGNIS